MPQPVTTSRVIALLYLAAFVGIGIGAGALFFEAHAEYRHQQRLASEYRRQLAAAEARLAEQQRMLERLRTDPTYVEKMLRERYHARSDELIFRFKE